MSQATLYGFAKLSDFNTSNALPRAAVGSRALSLQFRVVYNCICLGMLLGYPLAASCDNNIVAIPPAWRLSECNPPAWDKPRQRGATSAGPRQRGATSAGPRQRGTPARDPAGVVPPARDPASVGPSVGTTPAAGKIVVQPT